MLAAGKSNAAAHDERLRRRDQFAPVAVLRTCATTGRPLTVKLPGGYLAEYMRTRYDCMRAALATLGNVPYEAVPAAAAGPDLGQFDASQAIADLGAWARGRDRRLTYHASPPIDCGAWLGAVAEDEYGPSHAAVFSFDQLVHDPATGFPLPPGHELVPVTLADITWGITLDRLEDR